MKIWIKYITYYTFVFVGSKCEETTVEDDGKQSIRNRARHDGRLCRNIFTIFF